MTSIPNTSTASARSSSPWRGAKGPVPGRTRFDRHAASGKRWAEGSFHLTAHLDGGVGGIEGHIRPTQRLAFSNVAVEVYAVGEAKGQVALRQRNGSRRLLAPDQKAAFAIEHLAPF